MVWEPPQTRLARGLDMLPGAVELGVLLTVLHQPDHAQNSAHTGLCPACQPEPVLDSTMV